MLQPKRCRIKCCSSFVSRCFHHMDDLLLQNAGMARPFRHSHFLLELVRRGLLRYSWGEPLSRRLQEDIVQQHLHVPWRLVNRDKAQTKETMYVQPKTTRVQTYLAWNNDFVMTWTSDALAFVSGTTHTGIDVFPSPHHTHMRLNAFDEQGSWITTKTVFFLR